MLTVCLVTIISDESQLNLLQAILSVNRLLCVCMCTLGYSSTDKPYKFRNAAQANLCFYSIAVKPRQRLDTAIKLCRKFEIPKEGKLKDLQMRKPYIC